MALRAIAVAYRDPFTRRDVWIEAARDWFLREYQMSPRPEAGASDDRSPDTKKPSPINKPPSPRGGRI
jgi:hypothetical protein